MMMTFARKTKIGDRLDAYEAHGIDAFGPAECPVCHNTDETVWAISDVSDELVCRNHVGHPLYNEG